VLTVMQMAKRKEVVYEPNNPKGHKYSGALKAPIVMQTIPDVMDDVLVDIFLQRYQKLELLLEDLRIDLDEGVEDPALGRWFWLAFRLACRHVPGFRITRVPSRKVGRPPTIDDPLRAAKARKLIEDLNKSGRGIAWCVQRAHKLYPEIFPSPRRQRYYELLKPRMRKKTVR
jgi:hypothetical protein